MVFWQLGSSITSIVADKDCASCLLPQPLAVFLQALARTSLQPAAATSHKHPVRSWDHRNSTRRCCCLLRPSFSTSCKHSCKPLCPANPSVLQEYGYYSGDDLWGYDDYYDEYYDYYDDVDTVKDCTVDKDGKVKLANGTGEAPARQQQQQLLPRISGDNYLCLAAAGNTACRSMLQGCGSS